MTQSPAGGLTVSSLYVLELTSLRSPKQPQSVGQEEGRVNGWEGVHRARHSDICCAVGT